MLPPGALLNCWALAGAHMLSARRKPQVLEKTGDLNMGDLNMGDLNRGDLNRGDLNRGDLNMDPYLPHVRGNRQIK